MMAIKAQSVVIVSLLGLTFASSINAADIRIAVASNFRNVMTLIIDSYEANSGDAVIASYASTGKHFSQINNGAPFDIFFAADKLHPMLLVQQEMALANSLYVYAIGKLVLWSPIDYFIGNSGDVLNSDRFRYLAIANENLAPYGSAAIQTLERLGLSENVNKKLVRGENVNQAFAFVNSRNAELGFVALSQVIYSNKNSRESYWLVPQDLYDPIEQLLVVLRENDAVDNFVSFVKSEEVQLIIKLSGYDISDQGER